MSRSEGLAKIARWSYFLLTMIMIMGSFVHLNIKFNQFTCRNNAGITLKHTCIGRNLIWMNEKQLKVDSNQNAWRTVFNLTPDYLLDIWAPLFFSVLAFLQHFKGSKWEIISGSWFRAFCFIMFWMLFGVFGYAANWGVFSGFFGLCWVDALCFILIFISVDDDCPVLQLDIRPAGAEQPTGVRSSVYEQQQTNNQQFNQTDAILSNDNAHNMNLNETINVNDNANNISNVSNVSNVNNVDSINNNTNTGQGDAFA